MKDNLGRSDVAFARNGFAERAQNGQRVGMRSPVGAPDNWGIRDVFAPCTRRWAQVVSATRQQIWTRRHKAIQELERRCRRRRWRRGWRLLWRRRGVAATKMARENFQSRTLLGPYMVSVSPKPPSVSTISLYQACMESNPCREIGC